MKKGIINKIVGIVSCMTVILVTMIPVPVSATETILTKTFTATSAYEYYADNLNLTWTDLAVSGNPFQTSVASSIMLADNGSTFYNGYTCSTASSVTDAQNIVSTSNSVEIYGQYKRGQSFTALGSGGLQYITFKVSKTGTPGDLTLKLYAYNTSTSLGALIGSVVIPQAQVSTFITDYTWAMSNLPIEQGLKYVVMGECSTGTSSNYYRFYCDTNNSYSGGTVMLEDGSTVSETGAFDLYFSVTRLTGSQTLDDYYRNILYFNLDGLLDNSKIRSIEIVMHQSGTIVHKTKAVLVWNPANLESQTDGRWFMANAYNSTDYMPLGQIDADKGAYGLHSWVIEPTEWDTANQVAWLTPYIDGDNNLRIGMILEDAMIGYPSTDTSNNVLWNSGEAYLDEWVSPGCPDMTVGEDTIKIEPYIIVSYVDGAFYVPPPETPTPETPTIGGLLQIIPDTIGKIGEQDSGVRWLIMLTCVAASIALCWQVRIMAIVTPLLVVGAFIAMQWIDIWLVLLLAALGAFVVWQMAGGKRLMGGDG